MFHVGIHHDRSLIISNDATSQNFSIAALMTVVRPSAG